MSNVIDFPSQGREAESGSALAWTWDQDFIRRHDVTGPRYTSYPTAMQFHEEFTREDYLRGVDESNRLRRPLSLYVHLPFCASLCYYCACNKVVTQDRSKIRTYLDHLIQEIRLRATLFGRERPVYQLHWGGGTPNTLDGSEMTELMYHLGRHFNLVQGANVDHSIELDPRHLDVDTLGLLRGLGFNRVSFGIQDFDEDVQVAINRVQPEALIRKLVAAVRSFRFDSLNFDLIYGLPRQGLESVKRTVRRVIDLAPDRVSVFNYAHLPARFRAQRLMDEALLPSPDDKLSMLSTISTMMVEAGYVHIGMDHYAKPSDPLAQALANNTLHRNFQGYTTHGHCDLIGLGVSAISQFEGMACQNEKSVTFWQEALENGSLPITSGLVLSHDDRIRRDAIMGLLCHDRIDFDELGRRHKMDAFGYFSKEIQQLSALIEEGLLRRAGDVFKVTVHGRWVIRKICMVFDVYLPEHLRSGRTFSRVL